MFNRETTKKNYLLGTSIPYSCYSYKQPMFETQHKELVTIGIEIWLNSGVRVPADRGAEI